MDGFDYLIENKEGTQIYCGCIDEVAILRSSTGSTTGTHMKQTGYAKNVSGAACATLMPNMVSCYFNRKHGRGLRSCHNLELNCGRILVRSTVLILWSIDGSVYGSKGLCSILRLFAAFEVQVWHCRAVNRHSKASHQSCLHTSHVALGPARVLK